MSDNDTIDIDRYLQGSLGETTSHMARALMAAADSESEGIAAKLQLIGRICSMELKPDDHESPFVPMFRWSNGSRSAIVSDFSAQDVDDVVPMVSQSKSNELKSRVFDVAWLVTRDHKFAKMAIPFYFTCGIELLEGNNEFHAAECRIVRAINLAMSLGKKDELGRQLIAELILKTEDWMAKSHHRAVLSGLSILQSFEVPDISMLGERAVELARAFSVRGEPYLADRSYELADRFLGLAGATSRRTEVAIEFSRVAEARFDESVKNKSEGSAANGYLLEHAIVALRRVGGQQERIEQLHKKLQAVQAETLASMQTHSVSIDLGDAVKKSLAAVEEGSILDAVRKFAKLAGITSRASIEERVKKHIEIAPLIHLFPKTKMSPDGKILAKRGSLLQFDGTSSSSDAFDAEMDDQLQIDMSVAVKACINPARSRILEIHQPQFGFFLEICQMSSFVPSGHEFAFARGLYHGMWGDLVESTSILVPQFEAAVRNVFSSRQIQVRKLDNDGIERDLYLHELIKHDMAQSILGIDLCFTLKSLLVSRHGPNLRNEVAHGLCSDGIFFAEYAVYFWWLCLKMVVFVLESEYDIKSRTE